MDNSASEKPSELLKRGPELLSRDLDLHLSGPSPLSTANGHAFAEGAGFNAMVAADKGHEPEAKLWAGIAIRTYEALAGRMAPSNPGESAKGGKFLESAMILRSAFIGRYGESGGDFILDPNRLKTWFMSNLEIDLDAAREMARNWKALPIADMHKLRSIKKRLLTLRAAMASGSLGADEELKAWKALEPILP
ncbi:MAG TPA: hypothetical protein VJ385_10935 [Fibrobacteria bacterium]|nr:hypothetical protein [Fibrobacteria bacterium]